MSYQSRSKPPESVDPKASDQLSEVKLSEVKLPSRSKLQDTEPDSDHDHKNDHKNDHDHDHDHDNGKMFDLMLETYSPDLCSIRDTYLTKYSVDDLKSHHKVVQGSIDAAQAAMPLLGSVAGVFGSFISLMTLEKSDVVSGDVHKAAHDDVSAAIKEFESKVAEHRASQPDGQTLVQEEELQRTLQQLCELVELYKQGADDTNHTIQTCPHLDGHHSVRRRCQLNTDEFKSDVDGTGANVQQLLQDYQSAMSDQSLSDQQRCQRLAEIGAQAEGSVHQMESQGRQYQADTEELIEETDIPQEQKTDIFGAISNIWNQTYSAAQELWTSIDETLHSWAKSALGGLYESYAAQREQLGRELRAYQQDEYTSRKQRQAERRLLAEQPSLYSIEQPTEKEQDPDRPTTTVDQVYEELVPVVAKLRRFVEYIALVLPMPYSEHDRDYRQRRELSEEREKARKVDELLGKSIVKGIDDTVPSHENLTRYDGWKMRFNRWKRMS